jgi:hypothetical protein
VDWYPWGEEAFQKARAEDKPILLSVGYSACHWCHVMERESFEDEGTAALMNERFVNVKVDREERPDLDQVYQHAVQMLTSQGGWPLTVFLTPDRKPFFGGTYFPPDERYGRPSFQRVLLALSTAWKERRADVESNVRQIMEGLRRLNGMDGYGMLSPDIVTDAAAWLVSRMDDRLGGFRGAPKFPNGTNLAFLLGRAVRGRDVRAREAVLFTLRCMAAGGIYDQVGGGFHRYSVDDHWLVPHFEKMLYDNAMLVRRYLDAWRLTGEPFYKRIADEAIAYVLREMRSPEGGFFATQDADSEGEEGKFFVWSPEEIEAVVGAERARVLCAHFGVTREGNFEHGKTVLHVSQEVEAVARDLGRTADEIRTLVAEGRAALLAARSARVPPFRDEKILTSWNGLMIGALARSPEPEHVVAGCRAADLVLSRMWRDGRLLRSCKDGVARHEGVLDDYSFLAEGLLQLHQATLDPAWLRRAFEIADALLERFYEEDEKAFYLAPVETDLVQRPRSAFDQAIPSGAGVACRVLEVVGALTGERNHTEPVIEVLRNYADPMRQNPFGFGTLLEVLDGHMRGLSEVVVVGEAMGDLASVVRSRFDPDLFLLGAASELGDLPLVREKTPIGGRAAAYVCRGQSCLPPVTEPAELERLLEER